MPPKDLLEQRARKYADARAILAKAEEEKRDPTPEEEQRVDQLIAEVQVETKKIERQRSLDAIDAQLEKPDPLQAADKQTRENPGGEETAAPKPEAVNTSLRRWFGVQDEQPSAEDREVLRAAGFGIGRPGEIRIQLNPDANAEKRAQSVGTDTAGGHLVPTDFRRQLERSLLFFGGMRQARTTVIRTANGANLEIPTVDDTSNTGAILAENTQDSEQDVTFGQVILGAFKYSSKIVRVSVELLQDSAFDIGAFLGSALGERLGRIHNTHFTTGSGSGQPNGVVTASSVGKTGTTGQTTSVIYEDLVDLMISVDVAYRMNAEWMFSDNTLGKLMKLKDSDGRPLWQAGVAVGQPDTILGKRYIVNNDVADMAASAKSILFGDFSKYWIRDVLDITVRRLVERYADFHQEAFVAISRTDGDLIDAGTDPIKHYANSAT